jgi:DNA-packaging protein gp3
MANHNPPTNAFKPDNRLYRRAIRAGRLRKFATPGYLWQKACCYFEYCATSPIPTLCLRGGKAQTIYRIRPMSISDLCRYLEISHLDNYKKIPEYVPVITRIRYVIYEYNYTRAAAGFLKGRIISRTLRKEKKAQPALLEKCQAPIKHFSTYSPQKTPHYLSLTKTKEALKKSLATQNSVGAELCRTSTPPLQFHQQGKKYPSFYLFTPKNTAFQTDS